MYKPKMYYQVYVHHAVKMVRVLLQHIDAKYLHQRKILICCALGFFVGFCLRLSFASIWSWTSWLLLAKLSRVLPLLSGWVCLFVFLCWLWLVGESICIYCYRVGFLCISSTFLASCVPCFKCSILGSAYSWFPSFFFGQ